MGVRPSMGTVGDAYDNAMAESFFAPLECELIDRRSWQTKTEARLALFTYIKAGTSRAATAARSARSRQPTSNGAIKTTPTYNPRTSNTTCPPSIHHGPSTKSISDPVWQLN